MRRIKETAEVAYIKRDFLKEQIKNAEAKVEIAEGTLIGMVASLGLLTVVLIGMALFL